jgi:hypothetical protein
VKDERLRLSLFAADPDIVTPIGVAVDRRGRIFVIESHTHMPNPDYKGPKEDCVKVLEDRDGDGRAERVSIYAKGWRDAMTLAFAPDGTLYVCHRTGVTALYDRDGDGICDDRKEVLTLETRQTFSHGCLLNLTFDSDGWMYVSRGNLAGHPYTLRGTDGKQLSGYGDGGDIVRCRPDGSLLQRVATGFWNPFDMKFDRFGRLLCVDNDPDSRGPNRLVHVISGGDYGFKSHYGPSGLHPYDAWDGELPGTLPFVAPTGEAPSGLLDTDLAALPEDYRGSVLVTNWGEHNVERFRLQPRGVSVTAKRDVLIQGGREFRPVCIDAAPDGSIYFTDWVLRNYPNHGRGRVWKLSTRPGVKTGPRRGAHDRPEPLAALAPLNRQLDQNRPPSYEELKQTLSSKDPFLRSAAVQALARQEHRERLLADVEHADAAVRLGVLLALRRSGHRPSETLLQKRLADADEAIRKMALIWVGEARLTSMTGELKQAVVSGGSASLLEVYLATRQLLEPEEVEAFRRQIPGSQIKRPELTKYLDEILLDRAHPPELHARALALLDDVEGDERQPLRDMLIRLARTEEPRLKAEAVRTLARFPTAEGLAVLEEMSRDRAQPAELRADAVLGLAHDSAKAVKTLLALLDDPKPAVRLEAARSLRPVAGDASVRKVLDEKWRLVRQQPGEAALAEQLAFALAAGASGGSAATPPGPKTDREWQEALKDGGDVTAGRRVFYDRTVNCANCHRVHGRGSQIGPDLSTIGGSFTLERLIDSILHPSHEIAQEYQTFLVELTNGKVLEGLQFHFRDDKHATMIIDDGKGKAGKEIRIDVGQIESYRPSEKSLMPDGVEKQMTLTDFRNLIAFLTSLK